MFPVCPEDGSHVTLEGHLNNAFETSRPALLLKSPPVMVTKAHRVLLPFSFTYEYVLVEPFFPSDNEVKLKTNSRLSVI